MKITSFTIRNYRGISKTTINLNSKSGTIYTLVGLNESGKTTILEAINSFSPDLDGAHAMAQKSLPSGPTEPESLIPKKKKDNFNDNITICAHVTMSREEIQNLANECKKNKEFEIDVNQFPQKFQVTRKHSFTNSKHDSTGSTWNLDPLIKRKDSEEFVTIGADDDEWHYIVLRIRLLFPRIIYFPTFLFNFPERIQITEGDSEIEGNEYFKQMIEDALAFLDDPLTLQTHIVGRIMDLEPGAPFEQWLAAWERSNEKDSVDITLGKLSQKISKEIFGRWKEILGVNLGNKELDIKLQPDVNQSNERVVYLIFTIKDGYTPFKVSERSLGFRWFFCFLLFTRFFRGHGKNANIFLFDEPASNLHSAAQIKLLESLEDIADGKNDIIYSTHSHYLIEPSWLETAFIVSNGELTAKSEAADADFGIENADIKALPYSAFMGQNAEKSHYFQPILDKLDVTPSMLEATRKGVFTEGKSDFYLLNWYKKYHDKSVDIDFIPIGGADNAAQLMSLYCGLCLDFVLLLDGDRKGDTAKKRYIKNLPISEKRIIQLTDIFETKIVVLEDLLSEKMKQAIANKYSVDVAEKGHIMSAFSEALSGKNNLPADPETLANLKMLCDKLKERLAD